MEDFRICINCTKSPARKIRGGGRYKGPRVRTKPSITKAWRLSNGLCVLCGGPNDRVGLQCCSECFVIKSAREKVLIQARYDKGLCHCGNPKVPGYSACQGCIDRKNRETAAKVAAGICLSCPNPVTPGRARCSHHLLEMRIRNLDVLPEEKVNARKAVEDFDGVCQNPGCGSTNPGSKNKEWCLDHCHDSKKFRGILCMHCNSLLGYGKDDPDILAGAIEYLERFQSRGRISSAGPLYSGQPEFDSSELRQCGRT